MRATRRMLTTGRYPTGNDGPRMGPMFRTNDHYPFYSLTRWVSSQIASTRFRFASADSRVNLISIILAMTLSLSSWREQFSVIAFLALQNGLSQFFVDSVVGLFLHPHAGALAQPYTNQFLRLRIHYLSILTTFIETCYYYIYFVVQF